MGKTSDRLKDYQTQMSIYAEQHKLILASDVLDMIEQLQDDLKDDVEKVVENINNIDTRRNWNSSCEECINHTTCKEIYNEEAKTKSNHLCSQVIKKLAIKEVRKGDVG